MGAFASGLASVGKVLSNPSVNKGLKIAGNVGNSIGSNPAFGGAPTPQPGQPGQGGQGFAGVNPPTEAPPPTSNIGDIFRQMYAKKFATPAGAGPNPQLGGGGIGSPAPGGNSYTADSVRN
jgi:hypothetical protein